MKNWTFERWISVLTFLAAVITFIFTLGVNYAEVKSLRADFDQHVQQYEQQYLRQSEAVIQFEALKQEVKRLHEGMDRLTNLLLEERVTTPRR